ncbi:Bor family protein [Chitinophaga rhizophila]|uniref:Bor family protein n=1 Tax=Chitinophaga rhizophila TaxID=2866212 RepID=A0ABS7G6P7_9BACT|nr:Bor family protein [Chitinophaga rhizophila]MBW8682950.1 Bor family protein [Chitinophaga rhizophila]
MHSPKIHSTLHAVILSAILLCSGGCYSYRLATQALPSTGNSPRNRIRTCSLFWGLLNKPQIIHTPVCDSLGVNGVAEVRVRNNFGNALLTVCTLGVYCPLTLEWQCSTPCSPTADPL